MTNRVHNADPAAKTRPRGGLSVHTKTRQQAHTYFPRSLSTGPTLLMTTRAHNAVPAKKTRLDSGLSAQAGGASPISAGHHFQPTPSEPQSASTTQILPP
ncbi:MAG: hypothetical protein Q4C87_06825 [Actinomycetaceae bacterium]|nr:hypothetical protein [Actinomycetaceae bacterium]